MEKILSFIIESGRMHGVQLFWIVVLFFLGRIFLKRIVRKAIKAVKKKKGESQLAWEKRAKTLGGIIITAGNLAIYIIILLMVLRLFGVDIAPLLAGAGVVGFAIGFGSQSLVKDLIAGLFILIENQYGIGDKVQINALTGRVVKITVRSTVLKDEEGKICYVPNGSIKNVINFSQKKEK